MLVNAPAVIHTSTQSTEIVVTEVVVQTPSASVVEDLVTWQGIAKMTTDLPEAKIVGTEIMEGEEKVLVATTAITMDIWQEIASRV